MVLKTLSIYNYLPWSYQLVLWNKTFILYPPTHLKFGNYFDMASYVSWLLFETIGVFTHDYNRIPHSAAKCSGLNKPLWVPGMQREIGNVQQGCSTPLCPQPITSDFLFRNTGDDNEQLSFYPDPPQSEVVYGGFPCSGDHGTCESTVGSPELSGVCDCNSEHTVYSKMEPILTDEFGKRRVPISLVNEACTFDRRGSCATPELGSFEICGGTGQCVLDFVGGRQRPVCECIRFPVIESLSCNLYPPTDPNFCTQNEELSPIDSGYTSVGGVHDQCSVPPKQCSSQDPDEELGERERISFQRYDRG
jgi:hypothetical protein